MLVGKSEFESVSAEPRPSRGRAREVRKIPRGPQEGRAADKSERVCFLATAPTANAPAKPSRERPSSGERPDGSGVAVFGALVPGAVCAHRRASARWWWRGGRLSGRPAPRPQVVEIEGVSGDTYGNLAAKRAADRKAREGAEDSRQDYKPTFIQPQKEKRFKVYMKYEGRKGPPAWIKTRLPRHGGFEDAGGGPVAHASCNRGLLGATG